MYTVTDRSPFLGTPAEVRRVSEKGYPDAGFDNYEDARSEALRRSFINTAISSEVVDAAGCTIFVALER
jgi:hypothetical protein